MFEPLSQALALLFASKQHDAAFIEENFTDQDGTKGHKIEHAGQDVDLMNARLNQTKTAISQLFTALSAEENRDLLAEIIRTTLRGSYDDSENSEEILEELDLADLSEILKGAWAANRASFGPLALRVERVMKEATPPDLKAVKSKTDG